ncbi:MAG: hypothetical protein AAF799_27030 [Myxococcota bacterium]
MALTGAALLVPTIAQAEIDPWASQYPTDYARTVAHGDFDDDNNPDSVFGYPMYSDADGLVGIHFGTGSPRTEVAAAWSNSESGFEDDLEDRYMLLDGDEGVFLFSGVNQVPGQHFGTSVAVGDFDGNGHDDLAFGIPHATVGGDTNAGAVVVINGEDLGDGSTPPNFGAASRFTQDTAGVTGSVAEPYDYFGDVIAAGDVNCDGYDDLVVGVPRENIGSTVDAGMVNVLYGSASGLLQGPSSSYLYQGTGPLDESPEAYDRFGSSLGIGRYTTANYLGIRGCNSLAIGVPDEDVDYNGSTRWNSGVVHLVRAPSYGGGGGVFTGFEPITSGVEVLLDQTYGGVSSAPESHDRFGGALGRVSGAGGLDDLWIGVPGEGWGGCPEGITHTLAYDGGEVRTCSSVRPDLGEVEAGHVVQKFDDYGGWLQYIPAGLDPSTAEVFVVVPGTNRFTSDETDDWGGGLANTHLYMSYTGFVAAADELGFVLIMPQFEDWSFGNDFDPSDDAGGFRALLGANINADEWVETIVDRYAEAGVGDGRFHLFGHSAGGQFALRYFTQHPDRLMEVILETPGQMVHGTSGADWPNGLSDLSLPNSSWGPLSYSPSTDAMETAVTSVGALMVVGETEIGTSNGNVFQNWTTTFPNSWGRDQIDHCMVPGVGHGSIGLYKSGLLETWPDLSNHSAFDGTAACM